MGEPINRTLMLELLGILFPARHTIAQLRNYMVSSARMAQTKKPAEMVKTPNGKVRASIFLTPALNRKLKVLADKQSQSRGVRVSLSVVAEELLEAAVK